MWRTIQIILILLGLGLVFIGDKFSVPFFSYSGISCIGLTSMAIGGEAIVTRQIVIGSRRHGNRQSYTGIPAIFQGIQFNLFGLFLIVISMMMYLRANRREVFLQMVRHPGFPLVVFGALLLMQAVITLVGAHELQEGPNWVLILNLLVSRLLPWIILVVLGVGAVMLGLFEIIAPNAFDAMGGGFLEVLYGLK